VAQINNDHFRSFCRRLADVYEVENIQLTETGMAGEAEFVVIQHPLDPGYCDKILMSVFKMPDYQGVVILCGIHTSPEMEALWTSYKNNTAIRVTLDLLDIGIFICRRELQKEDFVLRFC
jgi:hypothetical protein